MAMTNTLLLFVLAIFLFLTAIHPQFSSAARSFSDEMHLLMPQSASTDFLGDKINCLSWRLEVETNITWKVVPEDCKCYVGKYMLGYHYECENPNSCQGDLVEKCMKESQYALDCKAVVDSAIDYVKTLTLSEDGKKDAWVFDIDETTLSNLPYYARPDIGLGTTKLDWDKYSPWLYSKKSPAVPGVVELYNELVKKGIKVVFLTGSYEEYREARIANLIAAGYNKGWEAVILKKEGEGKMFKSDKREELETIKGYRIVGNLGDQWSDFKGVHVGKQAFKLPNPLYYVG